jgi:hypothetical protein
MPWKAGRLENWGVFIRRFWGLYVRRSHDEFTYECLAIRVDRKLNSADVIDVSSDLFILRGVPQHPIRQRFGWAL